jgi:SAM-dependent methyltransferase
MFSMKASRQIHHPIFARVYGRVAAAAEKAGRAEHRTEMLAGLSGRVIEVGAGNGLNFAHYPPAVTQVLAVEPEPHLRRLAAQAAARAPVPVRVVDGTADLLPAGEAEFDAGVCSGVLCSVPDQGRALKELHRVIRPGGQLRFYEHVRSRDPRRARLQARIDRIWAALNGECHATRDTETAITAAGFRVQACRRFDFQPCLIAAPASPHILGRAIRVSSEGE